MSPNEAIFEATPLPANADIQQVQIAGEFQFSECLINSPDISHQALNEKFPDHDGSYHTKYKGQTLPWYWYETQRPLLNLYYLLPWLVMYEWGVSLFSSSAGVMIRNGADTWMRMLLHPWGIEVMLPLIPLCVLLFWHLSLQEHWHFHWETMGGMFAESLIFAFVLILMGQGVNAAFQFERLAQNDGLLQVLNQPQHQSLQSATSTETTPVTTWRHKMHVITFVGAGIYEEFLFRLCLIPCCYYLLRIIFPIRAAVILSILITSLLFALAHYLPSISNLNTIVLQEMLRQIMNSREQMQSFLFRALAGIVFACLYYLRGIGISMGCHACYDIMVGSMMISLD